MDPTQDPQFSADDPFADPKAVSEDEAAQQRQRASIQELIAQRLRRSVDARKTSGIEDIWQADDDQYNGIEYEIDAPNRAPSQWSGKRTRPDAEKSTRSTLYVNITKPKVDAYVARTTELLVPNDDEPWDISPTPVPELQQAIDAQDQTPLTLADGQQRPASDVAQATMQQAEDKAKKAKAQIADWFVEGQVYAQWRRVIHDAARIGTGCLKGPTPVVRRDRKWKMVDGVSTVQVIERLAPTSVAKSAWDIFPDPSCGEDIHAGSWLFERDFLTGRSLRDLARLPDYDAQAIAQILKEGPQGVGRYDDRYQREKPGQTATFDSDTFETYYYYGDLPPETLVAGGWKVEGLLDAQDDAGLAKQVSTVMQLTTVPVVVTMVNERIVRVSMNPLETGDFPIDLFVIEPVEGQPWGRSVGRKMAPAQKMLNGATRAMLENAGLSAGAQIVIDKARVQPANGRYEITGRKLWYWEPGDEVKDVRFAFQAVTIPSAQAELMNIVKFALEMSDQLTNLPMLMQGDQGSAPDTVGGMLMLEGNATSPLKTVAKGYDDRLVIPHLSRYYDWLMQDPSVPADCKGDMQIRARGASALVQRDLYASVLPQLLPIVKDPAFGLDPEKYILELLRSNKLNPTTLRMTDQQIEAQKKQMAQNPPMDPRIEAAHISADAKKAQDEAAAARQAQELQFKQQQAEQDRVLERYTKEIEFQIQAMEFADRKQISFEELRALMATKAMELKTKRDLFSAERQFAVNEGHGRGL